MSVHFTSIPVITGGLTRSKPHGVALKISLSYLFAFNGIIQTASDLKYINMRPFVAFINDVQTLEETAVERE
jgi:hypothetical protein